MRIRALESTLESLQGSTDACISRQTAADTTILGLHTDVVQASESVRVLAHCAEENNADSQTLKENQEAISQIVRKNKRGISDHKQLRDLLKKQNILCSLNDP